MGGHPAIPAMIRHTASWIAVFSALVAISCGRVAPRFAPHPGSLAVHSNPPGASIILDGFPTGLVTPDTIPTLEVGEYVLRVGIEGFSSEPESVVVEVFPDAVTLATFVLSAPSTGSIEVTSTPAGASIVLDHGSTGLVTPDTLVAITPGHHVVTVSLEGHDTVPETLAVTVVADEMAHADFTLVEWPPGPQKVVLLESLSNVSCVGCPELAATLFGLMSQRGYGTDRLLLIKYSMNWPLATDPMHMANTADNLARMNYYMPYLNVGIPTLVGDGSLLGQSGTPPDFDGLVALVDAMFAADPGFTVTVEAPLSPGGAEATVTLVSSRRVDLAGCALRVALVENPVVFEEPPGSEGETEFHWVMRDFATAEGALPALDSGEPLVRTVSLTRSSAWIAENLSVIAFVQNVATKAVLQAGFAAATPGAGVSVRIESETRAVSPEPAGGMPR